MAETLEPSLVGEIDTSAPFESVREAATHFGGFGFWKPSSHKASQNDVDNESGMMELEKELIAKEGETLKVLKSLESTKSIVEELKSKLQRKEEKENCDMSVFEELNQAKTNLCKTTEDLASIRESVKQLNKRLEDEQASLKKTRERLSHEAKELSEIEQTRNEIKTAEMRLVTARKMMEAAKAAEAVAMSEIKDVTRRGRRRKVRLQEEILESIEETSREIRRSRRTIEEGLEKVETEEVMNQTRRSSCSVKYKNPFLVDVNGLNLMMNDDGTSSSVDVFRPTMSIGQILSRKLLLAEETGMINRKVSLGQILGKTKNGGGGSGEVTEKLNGKRKRFGFAKLSVMLNKESKKNTNKKKKIALNLKG